jgi:MraZ protein
MFAGSYSLAIDDKGRIAIPARFRQQLSEGPGLQLMITKGADPCLEIYPLPVFNDIAAAIQKMTDYRQKRLLSLAWVGRAVEAEIDKQGRIPLPQILRNEARLNGGGVLVGQIDRFELWAEDRWNAMWREGPDSQLPALADAFQALNR